MSGRLGESVRNARVDEVLLGVAGYHRLDVELERVNVSYGYQKHQICPIIS